VPIEPAPSGQLMDPDSGMAVGPAGAISSRRSNSAITRKVSNSGGQSVIGGETAVS